MCVLLVVVLLTVSMFYEVTQSQSQSQSQMCSCRLTKQSLSCLRIQNPSCSEAFSGKEIEDMYRGNAEKLLGAAS
jgi:hypothetical protein